jgi:hypothetical protein
MKILEAVERVLEAVKGKILEAVEGVWRSILGLVCST